MKKLTKSITLAIVALTMTSATTLVVNAAQRGGMTFEMFDMNKDGTVSEDEFTEVRANRQAARAAEGRQLRNAANAPEFEEIDTDKNGKLNKTEFAKAKAAHGKQGRRGMGQGKGMGRTSQ